MFSEGTLLMPQGGHMANPLTYGYYRDELAGGIASQPPSLV